jgi:hypothetical protein
MLCTLSIPGGTVKKDMGVGCRLDVTVAVLHS